MIALDVVLWDGTVVLDPFLGQEIRGVGLLQERIRKVLAVMSDGKTGTPCGACRELMVQLMPTTYKDIEIMLDYEQEKIVTLGELTPEWWI